MSKNKWVKFHLAIGPVLFFLCYFLLPESLFESYASRAAIGTVAWMSYWWLTAPIDYAVTAFLPIALNAIFQMAEMKDIIANYACETILLLLGANIITVSWEETGLDKRIAAKFLYMIGSSVRKQVIFWFCLSTASSAVLPNSVACATITPIAVSMLKYIGHGDIEKSHIGSKILLAIAYAAGIGGLASPLGGAMNLVTVDYIQQLTGKEYMYIDWVVRFFPIMIVLLVTNLLFMLRDVKKEDRLGGSKDYFREEYKKMGKMTGEEYWTLAIFVLATTMAFTRQFYRDILPGLKPAYSFIICAIFAFLITRKEDGKKLLRWGMVAKKVIWGLIYIFAGGLAAGTLINGSGAADAIGTTVAGMSITGGIVAVCVFITIPLILSDVTSNTATAAVAIPIVISIVQGLGLNPIPYIYIASIGVNLSYMLPTSIRAIPVGYGLSPKYMFKEGWKMTVIVVVSMTLTSWAMMTYWPAFSE